jgi:hypothetical protein
MALRNDRYTYRVTWSENDKEYVGLCAEFRSLSWLAKRPETALKGIRDLVADVVKDMLKPVKRLLNLYPRRISAESSWYGCLPKFIASLPFRQHQGIENVIPIQFDYPGKPARSEEVGCTSSLGGRLNHYYINKKAA